MSSLIHKKIEEANKKYELFNNSDKVLVALSGGADSVALLLSLKTFYPDVLLHACHVNHSLRGAESDRDADFVKELCEKNGIPLDLLKIDVAEIAKSSGLSTELAARKVRYDFFEDVCRKHGINKVATAHTLSDNAETVLFNLTRGSGISGLCGIPPKRALCDGISIIRPLICALRSDVEEFLSEIGQDFVTDSTNLTDDYTRNYFRHQIIPLLKKVNPSFEENLKTTGNILRETQIFVDKTAKNNMTRDVKVLAGLDDCILSNVIFSLYSQDTGETLLENVHINAIASLIKNYTLGISSANEICLPNKKSAIITGGNLKFCETLRNKKENISSYCSELNIGSNIIDNTNFCIVISEQKTNPENNGYLIHSEYVLDSSIICGKLFARSKIDGDTITCCGMTKKVKSLFNHSKIDTTTRSTLPLICDESGVLIVPGIAQNDNHKNKSNKDKPLYIYILSKATQ